MIFDIRMFIRRLSLFLLLLIVAIAVTDLIYVSSIQSKKQIARQHEQYVEYISEHPTIKYAFFGDSHTVGNIDPAHIDGAFNLATNGENYIKTYFKVRSILASNVDIDTAVLELDPHSFASEKSEQTWLYEMWLYHRFLNYDEASSIVPMSRATFFLNSYLPFIGNGDDWQVALEERTLTPLRLGWAKNSGNFTSINRTDLATKQYEIQFKQQTLVRCISLDYFLKTVQLLNDNNVTIVFIMHPLSDEYLSQLDQHNFPRSAFYDNIFTRINNITKEYRVLDYHELYSGNPDYFGDSHHLNHIGSANFSQIIAHALQMPSTDSNQ